jgi:uncharacterized protein (TIGR02594 family)
MQSNKIVILLAILLTSNCSMFVPPDQDLSPIEEASKYIGYHERTNRKELQALMDIDPVTTQWCAAFVNSVLNNQGIPGTDSFAEYPLLARSFLSWGIPAETPEPGDIVVLSRGNASWKGHVGIYISTVTIDGVEYYQILGGNQDNSVSIKEYPTSRLLGIRKHIEF